MGAVSIPRPPARSNTSSSSLAKTGSFDHVFGRPTCQKHDGERVHNLLSEGIINADGTPGENFSKAHQFQVTTAPNGGKYFSSALPDREKILYPALPAPDLRRVRRQFPRFPSYSRCSRGRSRFAASRSVSVWYGRHGAEASRRRLSDRTSLNHQRQRSSAGSISPDDGTGRCAIRCVYRGHHPPALSDVSASGLRRASRDAAESDRLPARSSVLHDDNLLDGTERNAARHRANDGLFQCAAGRRCSCS